MSASLKTVNYRNPSTPQTEKAAPGQAKNNAGGYSFVINDFERAKRFIILGAANGYAKSGATFAKENAAAIRKLIDAGQSTQLVDYIVDVSLNGRAAKQQPALFALAIASSFGTTEEKQYALSKLSAVARTGTTLFEFVSFALQFRSWGRALKTAVANWYTSKDVNKLAFQMVKYQNREGWSHGDILRVTHPKGPAEFDALSKWALGRNEGENGPEDHTHLPSIVFGFEIAKHATEKQLPAIIERHGLTWEMVPNDKRSAAVWKALLPGMPLGAVLRQLPTLTRKDVLKPLSEELATVVSRLTDAEEIKRARLHPIQILLALKTYASGGRYSRGDNSWTPVSQVLDALNDAFYLAFANVEPTGKRFLLGIDVSPSMHGAHVNDSNLTSAEAVGALSLVISKTEKQTHTVAFASASNNSLRSYVGRGAGVSPLDISSAQRLDSVVDKMRQAGRAWGGTDAALPIKYALENNLGVDVFVTLTDNDTWRGNKHVHEALAEYRKKVNPEAKLVVLATSPSEFSIADPNDAGSLDIAGFDSATPQILAEFVKGF